MDKVLEIFAKRLKQARTLRKLSMDQLCKRMDGVVSKQAISKYESAKMMPNSTVLISIAHALGQSLDYFFRPFTYDADDLQVSFRKKSSTGAKDIEALKMQIQDEVERYIELEEILGEHSRALKKDCDKPLTTLEQMCDEARKLRLEWQLGITPIQNVPDLLQNHGIKVFLTEAPTGFDGVSGVINDSYSIIVLNKNQDHVERRRFTALHELAHLLFDRCFPSDMSQHDREKLCDSFANEMLIPSQVLIEQFAPNENISTAQLKSLQCNYGISINAILVKLHQLNIIGEKRYRAYNVHRQQDKSLKEYIEKSRYKEEIPDRFEPMVYKALAKDLISLSKASSLLGCSISTIRKNLNVI